MASGRFAVEQVDPIMIMIRRLEQARGQVEAGSLSVDAWDSLCDDKFTLEESLLEQTDVLLATANLGGLAQIWTAVAEFNERLVSIIDIIIDHSLKDYPSSEELASDKSAYTALSSFARAQAALFAAMNYRLSGNLNEAQASAAEAQQGFESLAKDGEGEDAAFASMQAFAAEALSLSTIAAAKQLRFQYQEASVSYLQAQKVMEKVRNRLVQSKDTTAAHLAGVLSDIYNHKLAAERALLLRAIVDGDFEKAATHADAMVKIPAPPDEGILPSWIAQSPKMIQSNAAAYLAYANAELAANRRNWDEAERQLADAELKWRQVVEVAIDVDIPQSSQVAESIQAMSAQTIANTRRRIERERSLHAHIAELEEENQQLQSQIFQLASEPKFGAGMSGDIFNFRDAKGAQVGRNNKQIIENSFNKFSTGHGKDDDLASQMRILKDSVTELVTELQSRDPDTAAEVAETFQSFAEESSKKQPSPGTLRVLGKALIDYSKRVAKVATPVASAVATVITIFGLRPI